jgi:hypothetical protein
VRAFSPTSRITQRDGRAGRGRAGQPHPPGDPGPQRAAPPRHSGDLAGRPRLPLDESRAGVRPTRPRIAQGLQALRPASRPSESPSSRTRRHPGVPAGALTHALRRDPRPASPPRATVPVRHARRTGVPAPQRSKKTLSACADVRSAASGCRVAGRAGMPFGSCSSEFHAGRANRPAIRPVQSQPATHPPRVVVVRRAGPLVQEPLVGGQCGHRCGPRGDEGADQGRSDLSGSRFDRVTRPPLPVSRERTAG